MRAAIIFLSFSVVAVAQQLQAPRSAQPRAGGESAPAKVSKMRFDERGWPIGVPSRAAPAPAGEVGVASGARSKPGLQPRAEVSDDVGRPGRALGRGTREQPLPSGLERGSALLDVYRATRMPGEFHALGGVIATWKLTVHGQDGEPIGSKIYQHVADCGHAIRDRLEYGDRVFVRDGDVVTAGRGGIRWESLDPLAAGELELFGLHLRMPWCFGDVARHLVVSTDEVSRAGQRLVKIGLEQTTPARRDAPAVELGARRWSRFALVYEPRTGFPRELEHAFAVSGEQRRVLLDDWRRFHGVYMPCRRVYVGQDLLPTTTIELVSLQRRTVDPRDFRQL